jgi:signal transduction histidine kinase
MIYAAVGLGILFTSWGVISRTSIDQVSALLLEERLATAQSVSAAFSGELHHMRNDLAEDLEDIALPGSDHDQIVQDSFTHLDAVDEFTYFKIKGIIAIDEQGEVNAIAPNSFSFEQVQNVASGDIWPLDPFTTFISHSDSVTIVVSIPIVDSQGNHVGSAHAFIDAIGSASPLVGFLPSDEIQDSTSGSPDYHLEVINENGLTILGIGPDLHDDVGEPTTHWDQVSDVVTIGSQAVVNGEDSDGSTALAVVPIIGTRMYLLAMRENDLSISAPARLQDLFIFIGVIGFAGAMLVVAFTTRRVVRPTSELTIAAERMAGGDLSSPVSVWAQDEIGNLAESIESMRVQLAHASEQSLRSNHELEKNVAVRTEQLRIALGQVISAQEAERKRVARDLHDVIAQEIVILARKLELARLKLESDELESSDLDELIGLARTSLDSTREISRALRPSMIDDLGLIPALSWAANELEKRSGIEVQIDLPATKPDISDEQTLLLFRAAQEAFANIDRHSKATQASISLTQIGKIVQMQIRDNGEGFEMPSSMRELAMNGHLGLIGMLERVELVGGELKIESSKKQSPHRFTTTVTASIPVTSSLS